MKLLRRGARPLSVFLVFGLGAAALVISFATPSAATFASGSHDASIDTEVLNFYRSRGGSPLWLAPKSGAAAESLLSLLSSAAADHLDPKRYNVKALARAIDQARSGSSSAI